MRNLVILMVGIALLLSTCATAAALTVTFDDVPSGTALFSSQLYLSQYAIFCQFGFQAADHTAWAWGSPHSSPNVLAWTGDKCDPYHAFIAFGHYGLSSSQVFSADSVSAYFSTETDTVIRWTAYRETVTAPGSYSLVQVASGLLGGTGQAWDNQYVDMSSPDVPFSYLYFTAVSGTEGLRGFCLDDMTVDFVPEPSSLLALLTGLAGVGAALRRRGI